MLNIKKALTKILGKCEFKTLLWENPSPSSAFSAQTIPLDLSGYDAVEVVFASSSSASAAAQYAKYPIPGEGFVLQNSAVTDRRTRGAKVTATGVAFGAGYSDSAQYNNISIPLKIYGIKLGGVLLKGILTPCRKVVGVC